MTTSNNRFYVGCDLGQSSDPTAICVVQRVGEEFRCGHLERLPLGTPYPAVISRVAALLQHPTVAGNVELAIDATGVGRPVADMFSHAGIPFTGVIITAGQTESQPLSVDLNQPGHNYRSVPKVTLVSHVQALLHGGKLKIRQDLPEADTLVRELQDFKVSFSATGYMSFNAREGRHDDLVLALSIAIWAALRQKSGQESWAEFLERGDWRNRVGTDFDPIMAPGPEFNFGFSDQPLHSILLPETLVHGTAGVRFMEGKPYIQVTRSEAKNYLSQLAIAALNPDLVRELRKH
jgi:hypothetical protein